MKTQQFWSMLILALGCTAEGPGFGPGPQDGRNDPDATLGAEDGPKAVDADDAADAQGDPDAEAAADGSPDSPPPGEPAVLVGAGDIATCKSDGDEATAQLVDAIPGQVFTVGDNVYEQGTAGEYAECYDPTWGRHKDRTRPAVGNHEYKTPGAAGHFGYFGEAAGDPDKGYYSYNIGTWHVVVLNSNCAKVGGCGEGSAQERWLREDLTTHPTFCTLAYFHHARFSSGGHGNAASMRHLWQVLDEAGADVVLAGHDHMYERFAPQDADGNADPMGIRQFTVGTGGRSHDPVVELQPNSEAQEGFTYGVLKLTLHADRYEWQFIPVAGKTFTDAGSASCL